MLPRPPGECQLTGLVPFQPALLSATIGDQKAGREGQGGGVWLCIPASDVGVGKSYTHLPSQLSYLQSGCKDANWVRLRSQEKPGLSAPAAEVPLCGRTLLVQVWADGSSTCILASSRGSGCHAPLPLPLSLPLPVSLHLPARSSPAFHLF